MTQRPRSPIGRLIVYIAFALAAGWGAVSVVGSIVVDLYAESPTAPQRSQRFRERSWCARRLNSLHSELDAQVTYEIGRPSHRKDALADWDTFDDDWRHRFEDARSRCEDEGAAVTRAYADLGDLYHRVRGGTLSILQARQNVGRRLLERGRELVPEP